MRIKVLSINIWHGGLLWESLIPFIHDQKPDILLLQEVYDGHGNLEKRFRTIEEFKKEFGYFLPNNVFEPTVIDVGNGDIPWGNAIFSKFPMYNQSTVFFDLNLTKYSFAGDPDPRLAAEGMVLCNTKIGDKEYIIGSWHGVWDTHGNDSEKRWIMGRKIIEKLRGRTNLIFGGDTNVLPTTEVISEIQNKLDLKSVFGTSLPTTFNMLRKEKPGYAISPVDMLFVSKDINILEKEMPRVDVSDHYPIWVCLEL